jgi:UrcA family protein
MSRQLKSLAFAAALATLAGAAANARPVGLQGVSVPTVAGDQIQTESVFYADLDLSREAGVQTLMTRINGAAKNVCGPAPDVRELHSTYQSCVDSAVNGALTDVSRATKVNLAMNSQRRHGG